MSIFLIHNCGLITLKFYLRIFVVKKYLKLISRKEANPHIGAENIPHPIAITIINPIALLSSLDIAAIIKPIIVNIMK